MESALEQDDIPLALPAEEGNLEEAAHLLTEALEASPGDANIAYLLALCWKRQGNIAAARSALRQIARPDANVWLQLGLLSFSEKQFGQAEEEFARARNLDPACYEAAFNLLLTRLCLGQIEASAALIPDMLPLAADAQERHFLSLIEVLLRSCLAPRRSGPPPLPGAGASNGAGHPLGVLGNISPAEGQRLLQMLSGLGRYPAAYPLLQTLAQALPDNQAVQEMHREAVLAQAKQLADRCDWAAAEQLLAPLLTGGGRSPTQIAALNLLGCCSCMLQDFDRAVSCFSSALIGSGNDPWLHQNLALTQELAGRLDLADRHWNRYFDLLDRRTPAPPLPNYVETLAFESFTRLADLYTKKERWQAALGYLQRAQRYRPDDVDTLERLFHLYNQVKRAEDARKTLRRLRELKPNEPQFDLYELDVRDTRTLEDIDRMLTDIRRILTRYPNDMRVEERAVGMVANLLPMISRMLDQYTEQFNKTANQVRRLPSYQVNWPAVHEVARDLLGVFQRLKRIVGKCQTLVGSEEQKRQLRELNEQIDRRLEACQSLAG